jgi:hypothetical protein
MVARQLVDEGRVALQRLLAIEEKQRRAFAAPLHLERKLASDLD